MKPYESLFSRIQKMNKTNQSNEVLTNPTSPKKTIPSAVSEEKIAMRRTILNMYLNQKNVN